MPTRQTRHKAAAKAVGKAASPVLSPPLIQDLTARGCIAAPIAMMETRTSETSLLVPPPVPGHVDTSTEAVTAATHQFVVVEARPLPIGWAAERRAVSGSFEDPPSEGHRSKRLQFDVGGTEG